MHACRGAAPGTLEGVKGDLENDVEIHRARFSSALLDTFDELGREFILAHGAVDFVEAHPNLPVAEQASL